MLPIRMFKNHGNQSVKATMEFVESSGGPWRPFCSFIGFVFVLFKILESINVVFSEVFFLKFNQILFVYEILKILVGYLYVSHFSDSQINHSLFDRI